LTTTPDFSQSSTPENLILLKIHIICRLKLPSRYRGDSTLQSGILADPVNGKVGSGKARWTIGFTSSAANETGDSDEDHVISSSDDQWATAVSAAHSLGLVVQSTCADGGWSNISIVRRALVVGDGAEIDEVQGAGP